MKDKDSKKPKKQAKIIKLKKAKIQNPLDDLMNDLKHIDKTLESHWKEETSEGNEEEGDDDDECSIRYFSTYLA